MYRNISSDLKKWKNQGSRKPLVLQGVRQCGKTYTLCKFGEEEFRNYVYCNFEREPALADIFSYDLDCTRILHELAIHKGLSDIDLSNTLLIFDEVQECPKAITSLKYFCEDYPQMYLVSAGSLLGPAIAHRNISFPVGKVEFLEMYPMSFEEFLIAAGCQNEVSLLKTYDIKRQIPDAVAGRLARMCKMYYVIGGMPEVVAKWLETNDFEAVGKAQDDILQSYANDFGKYLSPTEALKVGWIWNSVPVQLAKENNKFVFSHVKQGKRATDLEDALQWLMKAGLVYSLNMVSNPQLPLSFYADATYFKLYMCDTGLLRRLCGLSAVTILEATPLYQTFKGALTENFVMCELKKLGFSPYFWRSGNIAEVDFMVEADNKLIPIESKAETNTKAKSFALFCKRYEPAIGIKLSMNNVGDNMVDMTAVYSIPLYYIWRIKSYIEHGAPSRLP